MIEISRFAIAGPIHHDPMQLAEAASEAFLYERNKFMKRHPSIVIINNPVVFLMPDTDTTAKAIYNQAYCHEAATEQNMMCAFDFQLNAETGKWEYVDEGDHQLEVFARVEPVYTDKEDNQNG